METWQIREKHEKEVKEVLKAQGCLNWKGQIQRWVGPKVVPALHKAGHSSVGFDLCKCNPKA